MKVRVNVQNERETFLQLLQGPCLIPVHQVLDLLQLTLHSCSQQATSYCCACCLRKSLESWLSTFHPQIFSQNVSAAYMGSRHIAYIIASCSHVETDSQLHSITEFQSNLLIIFRKNGLNINTYSMGAGYECWMANSQPRHQLPAM